MSGDIEEATRLFEAAIVTAHELAYVRCAAHAELGCLAGLQGDRHRAHRHQQAATNLAPTTGVRDSVALAANAAGLIARFRGDPPAAKASHLQALAVFEELRSPIGIAHTHCCLGYANHHLGQASITTQHFSQALKLADRTGRPDILTPALEGLACVAAVQHAETCARLLGAARQLRQTTGIQLTMIEGHDPAEAELQARTALGPKGYAAAAAIGRRSSLGEILSLATNVGAAGSAPDTDR